MQNLPKYPRIDTKPHELGQTQIGYLSWELTKITIWSNRDLKAYPVISFLSLALRYTLMGAGQGWFHYHFLIDEETEAQRVCDLSKFMQFNERVGIWTQICQFHGQQSFHVSLNMAAIARGSLHRLFCLSTISTQHNEEQTTSSKEKKLQLFK